MGIKCKKGRLWCTLHYGIKLFDIMHTPGLLGWVKMPDIETVPIGPLFTIVTVKVECVPSVFTWANGKKLVKNIFFIF